MNIYQDFSLLSKSKAWQIVCLCGRNVVEFGVTRMTQQRKSSEGAAVVHTPHSLI